MEVSLMTVADAAVGGYVSWWKVIPVLLVLLLWGRLLTWMDKDAPEVLLPRQAINLGMIFPMIGAFFLFLILPGFAIALTVLVGVMVIEVAVYLFIRNQKAGLHDLQKQFMDWLASFKGGEKAVVAAAGEVLLINKSGNGIAAPADDAPEKPAYDALQQLLTEPLRKGAERIDLAVADGAYASKFVVDGVAYAGTSLDKGRGAAAIQYAKHIAEMDVNEKRKPQTGQMKISIDGRRQDVDLETAGSAAGEQMRAVIDPKHRHNRKLEELGFTDDQVDEIRELVSSTGSGGLALVSAPKGQGLTSAIYGILRAHDAFLTHIMTLEPDPDLDLEGITQNKMAAVPNAVEDAKQVSWCISQEPEVLMVGRVEDTRSATDLAKFAADRRVYVCLRAGSTFDAINVWRKLVGDDRLAMKNLRYVVSGRVLRKLCTACKVGYVPDPVTLRKLNMDPERVGKLYQARTTQLRDPKGNPIACEFCRELMFRGRVGVYETLIIDDDVRSVVEGGGSVAQLKAAFRKQHGKYLQEQALARVQAGETSVQEVLRVMKAGDAPPAAGSSGRATAPATA
jgi:type II secretory ATPase GspE/PulE/Tfp pilus assembly ATPase PilB-like protein